MAEGTPWGTDLRILISVEGEVPARAMFEAIQAACDSLKAQGYEVGGAGLWRKPREVAPDNPTFS